MTIHIYDVDQEAGNLHHLLGNMTIQAPQNGCCPQLTLNFWTWGHSIQSCHNTFCHPEPPFNRLFFFKNNGGELELGGKTTKLEPGVFYLLPENHPFTSTYFAEAELFYIHFTLTDRALYPIFDTVSHILELKSTVTAALFEELNCQRWNPILQTLIGSVILRMIPPYIDEEIKLRDVMVKHFGHVFRLIENLPPASIRIAELADAINMTPGALARKFQRHFGISLKEFLAQRTVHKAQQLLISNNDSLAAIATALGFVDHHYFYHFFLRRVGCTPTEFRLLHISYGQQ